MITNTFATSTAALHYIGDGSDSAHAAPVVLLHGTSANAYVWIDVMRLLATGRRVYALDQRGHGRSSKAAEQRYATVDYATDIIEFASQLGARPLLVGQSLGGKNALLAATMRPDLFAGLVSLDFTPYMEPEVFEALTTRVMGGGRRFANRAQARDYLRQRYASLPAEAVDRRIDYGFEQSSDGELAPLADMSALQATCEHFGLACENEATMLAIPTLFLQADDSRMVSRNAVRQTMALRPDLGYFSVRGGGDFLHETDPEIVAKAVAMIS
ncbi:alpha/beta fold hydrolase [soil metagenome]